MPKAVKTGTSEELWSTFTKDRLEYENGNTYLYIHASHSVKFLFNETAGTLTAVTNGSYFTLPTQSWGDQTTVFNSGTVFTKVSNSSYVIKKATPANTTEEKEIADEIKEEIKTVEAEEAKIIVDEIIDENVDDQVNDNEQIEVVEEQLN